MRIRKEWKPWDTSVDFKKVPGTMGVYEIADEQHACIYIGYAGGTSPHGLRGELYRIFGMPPGSETWNWSHPQPDGIAPELKQRARYFRYEENSNAYSRWVECLTRYREDYDDVPELNHDARAPRVPYLGRYHWKSEGI